jgi:hypothetical protein
VLSDVLPTWDSLIAHAESWVARNGASAGFTRGVQDSFTERFSKHYDPSWAAAKLLDPRNIVKGSDGSYGLAFSSLTAQQLADATTCIVDLAGSAHASTVRNELTALRLEPMPEAMAASAEYIAAKDRNSVQRGMLRKFWGHSGAAYPGVAAAAIRLMSMHPTSCASERNWSLWGSVYNKSRNRLAIKRAEKLIFIRGNTANSEQLTEVDALLDLLEAEDEPAAAPSV